MAHLFKQKNDFKNYYEVLEIPITSTQKDIDEAYKKARNIYIVDNIALHSVVTKDECKAILELVDEAYSILGSPNKRLAYDKAKGFHQQKQRFSQSPVSLAAKKSTKRPLANDGQDDNNLGISKIASLNHYALNYTKESSMEEKINNCQDFTGEFLREIREYKRVDISRMNNMTKISKNYIRNIEDDNIEDLPALAYIRGFVYQYAKSLKLNPDSVANSYVSRFKASK